jgi:acyl-CoA reductase-like NAD-dependent aldehyde dehydrogenase
MNYIAGEWMKSVEGRTYERENPARPSELIGEFPESTSADAVLAAQAAARAFPGWSTQPVQARVDALVRTAVLLVERQEQMAAQLTAEEGKPLIRARGEVVRTAEALTYLAHGALRAGGQTLPSTRAGVALSTYVEPVGPFLAITPFNFPLFVTVLKLGPALAAGNTVVWKPSPHTPLVSIALMQAFVDAGLPHGVLNLVMGGTAELGQSLVDADPIVGVSFTGSTAVGLDVGRRGAARHIRVQQEMGGKNLLVVGPDYDVQHAAEIACDSAFGESGQKCTAAGLVVVDKRRADDFLAAVEWILAITRVGDGAEPGTEVGPLVELRAMQRADDLLVRAIAGGAVCELMGPGVSTGAKDGYFFAPRVARLPRGSNALKKEESFAPILSLAIADDVVDESLELARQSRMGLSAAILTHNLGLAHSFARRVPAGLVSINLPTTGVEYQAPFGGWNMSGGAFPEAGGRAHEFYTRTKTVAINPGL